jgi:hypothetical protein
MDGRECGCVETDPERQSHDSYDGKKRALHQHAQTVVHILDYVADHDDLDSRPDFMARVLEQLARRLVLIRAAPFEGSTKFRSLARRIAYYSSR